MEKRETVGNQEIQPTKIAINWYSSKEAIAKIIRKFAEEANLGFKLNLTPGQIEGFIYDLGHPGRGYENFPPSIEVPMEKQEISIANLLEAIKKASNENHLNIKPKVNSDLENLEKQAEKEKTQAIIEESTSNNQGVSLKNLELK